MADRHFGSSRRGRLYPPGPTQNGHGCRAEGRGYRLLGKIAVSDPGGALLHSLAY